MFTGTCARRQGSAPAAARRGFTLIELLVALVLLDVGLLALVGMAAAISRDSHAIDGAAQATLVAASRLERLISAPCKDDYAAAEHPATGVSESFGESRLPNATRALWDSVVVTTSRGARTTVLVTKARC